MRGGKRKGAGRPQKTDSEKVHAFNVYLTKDEKKRIETKFGTLTTAIRKIGQMTE